MIEAIEPVAAQGTPRELNRGAKIAAGSGSRIRDEATQGRGDLVIRPIGVLRPQRSGF